MARNQPRLEATATAADLSTITFTFPDATNLTSRDGGHMDRVVYRFKSADEYTSQWTWYAAGKESWMEEIRCRRVRP